MNVTDPDCFVYHYTRIETAIEHILPRSRLRIGSFSRTNDPKEAKTWEFNTATNGNVDLMKYGTEPLSTAMTAEIKGRAKLVCFCRDRGSLSGIHLQDICQRGFAKPRMWAQYADNHTGVCLVFVREELDKRIRAQFGRKCAIAISNVRYLDQPVVTNPDDGAYVVNVDMLEKHGLRRYAALHLKYFHRRLFFEKMEDWRDENEFRCVLWHDGTDDLYCDYGDALKAIVFGDSVRPDLADKVMEITTSQKVEWQGLKWKNCTPWYDFGSLKYSRQFRTHMVERRITLGADGANREDEIDTGH